MKNQNLTAMVFYRSFYDSMKNSGLNEKERCQFYEGMMEYAFYGVEPEFDNAVTSTSFVICKELIDANTRKNRRRATSIANGQKGGAPKGNRNAAKHKDAATDATPVEIDEQCADREEPEDMEPAYQTTGASECAEEEKPAAPRRKSTKRSPETAQKPSRKSAQKSAKNTAKKHDKTTQKTTQKTTRIYTNTKTKTKTSTKTSSCFKEKKQKKEREHPNDRYSVDIDVRNVEFFNSLLPYADRYGMQPIKEFYDHWQEPNLEKTRMRFELEPTWDTDHRVEVWMSKRQRLERKWSQGY